MLTSLMDVCLSSIASRTNEVMKVLTIITTLFIPLTFLAGIHGTNFRFMQEIEWRYGYYVLLGAMATITGVMVFYKTVALGRRKGEWTRLHSPLGAGSSPATTAAVTRN